MIDINELRRLTVDCYWPTSPVSINEILDRLEATEEDRSNFIVEMGKLCAQCDALRLRIEAAEKECDNANAAAVGVALEAERLQGESDTYKAAYNEWTDKTEWVQQGFNEGTISAKYLGLHRADVMARLLDEAAKERDALRAKITEMEQQEPVAWLHETRRDSDVVTDAVKHVWGKVAVGSMAAYSIPLYALPGAQGEEK